MTAQDRLAAIRARLDGITRGPWKASHWESACGCELSAPRWENFINVSGNEDEELTVEPMFSKREWHWWGFVGLARSTNHRVRGVFMFRRVGA